MNPKSVALISSGLILTTAIAILIALALPGWIHINYGSPGYSYSIFLGPIVSCTGQVYFEDCQTNNWSCDGDTYCNQLSAARAFLIIGEAFAIISAIALLVSVCSRAQVSSTGRKLCTIATQAFTAVCFIISFALVSNVYLNFFLDTNASYGPSFILTVISTILVIISLFLFTVLNFLVKPHESPESTISIVSPLIPNSYNSAAGGAVYAQPAQVSYQNSPYVANPYSQQGHTYMHQQPHAQPFVHQQYQQSYPSTTQPNPAQ